MSTAGGHRGSLGRQEARGILLQLFEEDALGRDLGLDVAVGRAAHADGHGARSRMARSADHPHVVHEILAAELGADAALAADFQHLLLPFQVAEAASALVARGGQLVEVAGRSLLHRRKAHLGRRAADADGQVVGRAGRRAEVEDMLLDEFRERLLVQQRLGLLVEESLVGRAAALGDEEELVLHAGLAAVDVDLRGKVRARVLLVGHRKGHDLRIAQVAVLVGLVNAPGDALGVVGPVQTSSPLWPMQMAVPVSWQVGSSPSAETVWFSKASCRPRTCRCRWLRGLRECCAVSGDARRAGRTTRRHKPPSKAVRGPWDRP